MQAQEKKPMLRACDGCRMRKRKCNGEHPCPNCLKSLDRDENGNPICTYSSAVKKRGPKKGYKETLMQRLENLEAVLNPLSNASQQEETLNWATNKIHTSPKSSNNLLQIAIEQPFVEEEFELHLLRLGILYSQLSSNYRLSLIQGQDYRFHQVANIKQEIYTSELENGTVCKWSFLLESFLFQDICE